MLFEQWDTASERDDKATRYVFKHVGAAIGSSVRFPTASTHGVLQLSSVNPTSGTAAHELGHLLGLQHMHQRVDRAIEGVDTMKRGVSSRLHSIVHDALSRCMKLHVPEHMPL